MRSQNSRVASLQLAAILWMTSLLLSCEAHTQASSNDTESQFGLPGKADLSCDSRGHLCWSGEDAEAARTLMEIESEIAFGTQRIEALIPALVRLEHKFDAQERDAFNKLKQRMELSDHLDSPTEGDQPNSEAPLRDEEGDDDCSWDD